MIFKAPLIKEISDKKAYDGLRIIQLKPPENIKDTRRLMKEEEKWTPIEINICRRLQTSMAFFLPNLSEITPAVIRPNIREIWFRLTASGKFAITLHKIIGKVRFNRFQ